MRTSEHKVINAEDGSNSIRIRSNQRPNMMGGNGVNSRSRKQLPQVDTTEETKLIHPNQKQPLSPVSAEKVPSPSKGVKMRNKYAGIPSKIQSGVASSAKPPVPNFAANRAKREEAQKKADRLAPSKYLAVLIKQHYRRFSERVIQLETPKRVTQLTKMRKEMQRRFMLLYRHFRLKKYGEPIPKIRFSNDDDVEDMFKDDTDMLEKI